MIRASFFRAPASARPPQVRMQAIPHTSYTTRSTPALHVPQPINRSHREFYVPNNRELDQSLRRYPPVRVVSRRDELTQALRESDYHKRNYNPH